MTDLQQGICDFERKFVVTTYTSGNELQGLPVKFGEFGTEQEARQALADDGFTDGKFGWRKGYTDATIKQTTVYSNFRAYPQLWNRRGRL